MKSTPKIRGYVATKKNRIVFLYRKSNKITYLFLLNYQKNKENIQLGSCFHGKFYPNRCDLSPDGKYFLYFAMGNSQKQYDKKLFCWTGICIPPNIKANILFAQGDTWGGGGRFIDDKTIYISPGMYPDFDVNQKYQFDKYKITFDQSIEDGGWNSGKGWTLSETQITPKHGDKYPVPKSWIKTIDQATLIKKLNYDSYLKSNNGHTMGAYDLHSYEIQDNNNEVKYSLNDGEKICLWADIDNYGRLVIAREHKVFIYNNSKALLDNKPTKIFNLDELIT